MRLSFRDIARKMDSLMPPARLIGNGGSESSGWIRENSEQFHDSENSFLRDMPMSRQVGQMHQPNKGLLPMHRWSRSERFDGSDRRLRAAFERHRRGIELSLLWYNTWLIAPPGNFNGPMARSSRRKEIATTLANSDYDVMALCELFKESDRKFFDRRILEQVDITSESGPEGRRPKIGSGLHTIVGPAVRIKNSDGIRFDRNGPNVAETMAKKGVLWTELELTGLNTRARIDLFTTHMYAPHSEEIEESRSTQLDNLCDFIDEKRSPKNVTIVAGDFNIKSSGAQYEEMLAKLGDLGLYDAWLTNGGAAGSTAVNMSKPYSTHCLADLQGGTIGRNCNDYPPNHRGRPPADSIPGNRLDYVFVQKPTKLHSLTVDLHRMRRRPFSRVPNRLPENFSTGQAPPGTIPELQNNFLNPNYLSDHLALEMQLTAALK